MKFKDYLLIIILVIIDQLSKYYISVKMTLHQSIEVIKGFFSITYTRNTGAAWSMLQGQRLLFVFSAAVAIGLIIYYLNHYRRTVRPWEKFGLLLVASGALGNAIDRVLSGEVIDFLDFLIFGYDFPVFNFADCCVTIGVIVLLITYLFEGKGKKA